MRDGPRVIGSRVLLALVVSVTAGPSCSSDERAGCDWEPGAHTVEVDGVQRRYEVTVEDPDGPVVLSLHGALGNPEAFEASTGVAAASRGVVITPAAHGLWWRHRDEQSADVDFLGGLLCGDDVHAVGFSSGGMMALRLACDGLVASAVVVDGMVDLEPCDEHPPVLAIHGRRDDTIGWDGRMDPEVVALVGYRRGPTVPELVEAWGPAELITHDGGHVWPDEATAEAWDYIEDH